MVASFAETSPEIIALTFANAVATGEYELAHTMLSAPLRATTSVLQLGDDFKAMIAYADCPPENIPDVEVMQVLDEWADMEKGDTKWVYVAISNDYYCEAVSVIVAQEQGRSAIRELDWGRP